MSQYFTHNMMIAAVQHIFPTFMHGQHFQVLMGVKPEGSPDSDAWISKWPDGVPVPTMQELQDAYAASQVPTPAKIQALLSTQIQKRLDTFALTRRYDSVTSAAKYKDLSDEEVQQLPEDVRTIVLRFRAETRYLLLKTAETWARAELLLDAVQAGNWPTEGAAQLPTDISDIEADLPELEWPNV